jgi:large subunit ribosomal protein L4
VAVLDGASFDEPATKRAAEGLAKWGARKPTLVVLQTDEIDAVKSFRNIPDVDVMRADDAAVADIIGHASLVVSQAALETLSERAGAVTREGSSEESDQSEDSEESQSEQGEDSEE